MPVLDGFLIIDKPQNWTSFDVVAKIRNLSGQKKVGHAGTLDPLARGVLIIALGQARFLIDNVQKMPKTYQARIKLGQTSITDDEEGQKSTPFLGPAPTEALIKQVLNKFTGNIKQVPPDFAALKIKGQKMYQLARARKTIEKKERPVKIYRLILKKYNYPFLDVEATVGKGTYVRSLARDIGQELKTGAYLAGLSRTKIGPFSLAEAISPTVMLANKIPQLLIPPEKFIKNIPQISLPPPDLESLAHGKIVDFPPSLIKERSGPVSCQEVAVVNQKGKLLMLACVHDNGTRLKSKKIFDIKLRR